MYNTVPVMAALSSQNPSLIKHIIYNPKPDTYIVYWLSRQTHMKNKDEERSSMKLSTNVIDATTNIPTSMKIQDIKKATINDIH